MQKNCWPTSVWQTTEPTALGMNPDKLTELEPKIKADYSNINGIVMVRHGCIAYERYYNGCGPDDPHHVASVTKSVISALIGIAIDAGYIMNEDQKVLDFFPEYVTECSSSLRQEITLRHLLTMTAPYAFEDWHEPLDKMCMQPDWVRYTLDMLGREGSIGDFKYSTAGAHLLSAIITRSTGRSAREFANEHLFKPIGMREIMDYEMKSYGFDDLFGQYVKGWVHDPNGISTGGWGLTLTPRDMARFGLLYLNRGNWEGRQIISESWIENSIAMNSYTYGNLWWLREEEGVFSYSAVGDGGNVICCIPSLNLVIAIASEFTLNARDRWTLIKECIIPAVHES
ncbi:class C beta-lactamase-related serine hydrolase [Paenibacillus zeisoli]|uniref:Class C beta-lactamase-related serine hydrolase n=1 Tax=Paenibacillus zeisoli TaxID=2496267 RepID=A0A433XNU3_9BACL|nr:serine hydrolase [Paenibacillus zeisoli]RUT35739.1 class C beta-lactamase-related serine hydrolase [Paenibacillus zeisoli]